MPAPPFAFTVRGRSREVRAMNLLKRLGERGGIALALSLLSMVSPAVRAQESAPALTLHQALRRALEANASTATARSQVATSQAQVSQLKRSILPDVDLESAV